MARRKITSLKGQTVTKIVTSGIYLIIRFNRGAELQVHQDMLFDKDGNLYDNDAEPIRLKAKAS